MYSDDAASYIDYDAFLDPSCATGFANTLVLATNDPSDSRIDLATPLSRVLFDVQEVDSHIDTLTRKHAVELLEYTLARQAASTHILAEVETQLAGLTEGYSRLETDVIRRYDAAAQARLVADRQWRALKLARAVARVLMLARQLEAQVAELQTAAAAATAAATGGVRAMVRASNTLLALQQLLSASAPGQEGEGLNAVHVVKTVVNELVLPWEQRITARSQQIVREFSMSSVSPSAAQQSQTSAAAVTPTAFTQAEDMKQRTASALMTLYLLSPTQGVERVADFEPKLLLSALKSYLQAALTNSLAALTRSFAALPNLDRALLDVSARCQNIVALEALLQSTRPPPHPLLSATETRPAEKVKVVHYKDIFTSTKDSGLDDNEARNLNFLKPLLNSLDTSSLPSYFWRTLASSLSLRVQDIINRGGVSARALRQNRDRLREAIRQCVDRGSRLPAGSLSRNSQGKVVGNKPADQEETAAGGWEREAAVMISAIVGPISK